MRKSHWYKILSHKPGTNPARVSVYWKSKFPFSLGIFNFKIKIYNQFKYFGFWFWGIQTL